MFLYDFGPGRGWHNARIVPYGPLRLDPSCMALHYGQQAFEGLKAYRGSDGGIRLFRYRENLKRLQYSAKRLCMPAFNEDDVADALRQLVLLDRHWIPDTDGCSLYIRPNMIAVDPYLGVRPSERYLLYVILGPVGAYYPEGFNPVGIMVNEENVRAVRGGIGDVKAGGNYGGSLVGQVKAKTMGFTQVLWLDAIERRYVEEVGTMNIFFMIGDEVITAPLSGSILPGITRDSVLTLLRDWGYKATERRLAIDEIANAARNGTLREIFGTGTAAVVSPVGTLYWRGTTFTVGDGQTGPLAQKLYDQLLGIQYGRHADTHGWVERIDL
jgi:branched-chain amino acid aminotransferase